MKYIYLHGFASSPQSYKAQFFKSKFDLIGSELLIPDLNLGDFTNLKVSSQLLYLKELISNDTDYCLIGSSLGGLLALILAEEHIQVKKLILLAPAIEIKNVWDKELGVDNIKKWQKQGVYNIFHSGAKCEVPLKYDFIHDMQNIKDRDFKRGLPVLLIHGKYDKTIPVEVSHVYQRQNQLAKLVVLNCEHGMEDKIEEIWIAANSFINDI
ncbi:YqiA/YcfP family alpha/beta fold hydrolase [Aquella oligotrophica]|uniref:Esterase n=1 Tax=Aquella oligotrophica TaxID=2067065 RepID=A0A2I7N506_9NEIS|nr:YqiA/YcfP family alpha/beta fold hydrolase [Aquella oligotrophica]AUR51511.1 esterase [Aquella oligotrophica]